MKSAQRELNARRALEKLVTLVMTDARDAWKEQEYLLRDRAPFFGRAATLLTTVDKLSKVLLDHPDVDVRADRLIALHDMLEATAFLADCLKDSTFHRLRTAASRKAKADIDDQRREIVARVVGPSMPSKLSYSAIAERHEESINAELKKHRPGKHRLGKMEIDAIVDHMTVLWPRPAA
jgi:hypothetical protein